MAVLYNRACVTTATVGTGTMTLGSAVSAAYFTFAEAGVPNLAVVSYVIEDGTNVEMGIGTYTTSGTTLSRTTVTASKIAGVAGTTKLTLSGSAIVFITALAADINLTPAALTRTNDTNVTLTLGGTPTTALLQATSVTVGWSGTLAAARGGFAADVSASSGVPLFATGVATFTGTIGTGNFVRAITPTFTGVPLSTTAAVGTNTTQIATTAYVISNAATVAPLVDGTAAVGTSTLHARQDHVHPKDTAKFGVIRQQTFTASGTYTPHADMLYCVIECQGGGGGGGGAAAASAGIINGAGGGGGGEFSRMVATAATIGASKTVTIGAAGTAGAAGNNAGGAGGATSVTTICTALGGGGGGGAAAAAYGSPAGGGFGGTGSLAPGGTGQGGSAGTATGYQGRNSGAGGSSMWGVGGQSASVSAGNPGVGYGGGGSGGSDFNGASTKAGGAGTAGKIIITEFCHS